MFKKRDISFFDIYSLTDETPTIKINKNNFYGGFALEVPNSYDHFIDETIYRPEAYFKKAVRNGVDWIWKIKKVELEKCKLENIW